jgi:hypothetical protein
MNTHGRFLGPQGASAVFRQGQSGVIHLTFSGIAPQLGNQFMDLSQTGSADGMTA